jgi:hypothetical protein
MSASVRRFASPAPAADIQSFILQRSGARPMRFEGSVLSCVDEASPPVWSRLRLALYRRQDRGYVCEMLCIRAQYRQAGKAAPPAWCHAVEAVTLGAAVRQFETMAVGMTDTAPTAAPADAAAALFHAAGRLCRATAEDRVIRQEVGRFLYRLCVDLDGA